MRTEYQEQLTNDIADNMDTPGRELPLELVDALADGLVRRYQNPEYRKWYCGVIYEFGISRINVWLEKASTGDEPGKLFTRYVNSARKLPKNKGKPK